MTSYKKRVNHDRIIPREEYQDLYLLMRERHKHLVANWHESTDPLKHVFEVCVFAFLATSFSIFSPSRFTRETPRKKEKAGTTPVAALNVIWIGHRHCDVSDSPVEKNVRFGCPGCPSGVNR